MQHSAGSLARLLFQFFNPLIDCMQRFLDMVCLHPESFDLIFCAQGICLAVPSECRWIPSIASTPGKTATETEAPPQASAITATPCKRSSVSPVRRVAIPKTTAGHGSFSARACSIESWHNKTPPSISKISRFITFKRLLTSPATSTRTSSSAVAWSFATSSTATSA